MLQFTDAHTFAVVDRPVDDRGLYDSYDPSHAFVSAALSGGLTVAITLLFGRSGLDLTGVVLFVVAWAAFAIVGSSLIQHDGPNNPPRWDRTDVAVVLAPQVLAWCVGRTSLSRRCQLGQRQAVCLALFCLAVGCSCK